MRTYEEDRLWADQFLGHQAEIATKAFRVEVAPFEEDVRRNTDLVVRTVAPLRNYPEGIRFSARVRRRAYASRFRDEFTVRLDRPSGVETEYTKLRAGYGDFFIYGFESAESGRMSPWFIGSSAILRQYLQRGGYYKTEVNKDGSSRLAAIHFGDMPAGFVLDSEGLTVFDDQRIREVCRRCWWWASSGGVVCPTADIPKAPPWLGKVTAQMVHVEPGIGRWCCACGFWWRSGWVMQLSRARVN